MKNRVLAGLLSSFLFATAAHAEHHEAEEKRTVIGMGLSMDGASKPLYSGSMSHMKLWQDWIQAHREAIHGLCFVYGEYSSALDPFF
jgi:hypothetical protein